MQSEIEQRYPPVLLGAIITHIFTTHSLTERYIFNLMVQFEELLTTLLFNHSSSNDCQDEVYFKM